MKVLSVRGGHAYALCSGRKKYEERTWNTKHRGQLLIHVSGKPRDFISYFSYFRYADWTNKDILAQYYLGILMAGGTGRAGCIIGGVNITHTTFDEQKQVYRWHCTDAFFFSSAIIKIKGHLSLWNFDAEYLDVLPITNYIDWSRERWPITKAMLKSP